MSVDDPSKLPASAPIAATPLTALHQVHSVVLLRWVLIVATSYLVLFSRPLSQVTPTIALFVAAYLASNVALTELLPRLRSAAVLEWTLMAVDTAALTLALSLAGSGSNDLFVLYFAVLFVCALSERLGLVVGAAVLITVVRLYTVAHYEGPGALFNPGTMLQVPFLFVVALFFGHLVHLARGRERGEEERHARELRLDLLSGVSHDLKNPLGVIESLADLLLDGSAGELNDQQADLTRRIRSSTRQVIALSQNLIDAERIEAGRLLVLRRRASLARVVDDALVIARSASDIKGVALQVTVEQGLPMLTIDTVQIARVIANLLGNAIKFTPAGGRVRLTVRAHEDGVQVAVADDGPGIPPEELPRLAERHFRGTRSRGVDGSGLGLFIVRAVVEAHGGTLRITSSVGRGTTVTVTLLRDAPRESSGAAEVPVAALPAA
ncbi:MAG: ATP-binding protein [Deltaproteobacteria bacterium]|nr:ATP-binding protein [Deltaproteobacteria bacterium]